MKGIHMPDLVDEISAEADVSFEGGRTNNLSDLGCAIGAIASSFLVAVLAAVSNTPGWLVAAVAALPALFTSLQRIMDFRGRSAWYFVKYAKLRDLGLTLKYNPNFPPVEAAKQFGAILKEMEERWSDFVRSGSSPPAKSSTSGVETTTATTGTPGRGGVTDEGV